MALVPSMNSTPWPTEAMLRRILMCVVLAGGCAGTPSTMRAAVVYGKAPEGNFSKVKVVSNHPVPQPGRDQVLIRVVASSVNPVDWKLLSNALYNVASPKIPGFDVAGVIESVGAGCTRLKPGDEVWADLGKTKVLSGLLQLGAWAEFAVADESQVGLKPVSLNFQQAASLPLAAMTDLQALQKTGAPWATDRNVTVVITSGAGGTGTAAIQLAKWFGAGRIVTAASPSNAGILKKLGATDVIDYHQTTIWDALGEDAVDVVYDNYGAPGTADAAMASLRSGGVFVFLPGKGGAVSKHPKPGVRQFNYGLLDCSHHEDLDALAKAADAGSLRAVVLQHFDLTDITKALQASIGGHVVGKVGVDIATALSASIVI